MNDSAHWTAHYLDTLGNVPDAIEQLYALDAAVAEGYTQIRKVAYEQAEGRLDIKIRELLFVVIDIELGNFGGAVNHLKAGIRAGLTRLEFADALIQLILVRGISTWGLTGHRLWRDSEPWFSDRAETGTASVGTGAPNHRESDSAAKL